MLNRVFIPVESMNSFMPHYIQPLIFKKRKKEISGRVFADRLQIVYICILFYS